MVNGVNNTNDNYTWKNFVKKPESSPAIQYNDQFYAYDYKPNEKSKKSSNITKKIQIASLILGTGASTVFMIYMLKSISPFNKGKELLKEIKAKNLPENVKTKLLKEYDKYKKSIMDVDGVQNYIRNVLNINWEKPQSKIVDINKARQILDEDHIGLDNVKTEIIRYLNFENYNLKNGIKSNEPLILCLDGPPGTGKTSIAASIAKAMDRPFERISLAGISDKAFIKGAQRLYKNAEPGQIMKSIQRSGTGNPVILLDEIDKMGSSLEHGSPAFALLDALEPKQCKNFTDENIELPYDLSNVTFIITSNELKNIPEVLKNRLEIIHIPPYQTQEKTNICNFTIKKLMANYKIDDSQLEFTNDGIQEIVNQTNDQGARKTIENLRCIFKNVIESFENKTTKEKLVVDKAKVSEILKNKKEIDVLEENTTPDISNLLTQLIKIIGAQKGES